MKNTLKLFSIMFFLIFSSVFAEAEVNLDKYRLFVTSVDEEAHSFTVSNGLILYLAKNQWTSQKLPDIDNEIQLFPLPWFSEKKEANVEEGELIVFFDSKEIKNRMVFAWISPGSAPSGLSYVSTQIVCVEPAGWFSAGKFENIIELSDGSKWIQGPLDPLLSKEDYVILSPDLDSKDWLLINLNRIVYFQSHNVALKTLAIYRYTKVRPYRTLINNENN